MKKWPKDVKKEVDFCDLIDPLDDLMTRVQKEPRKNHAYTGYQAPSLVRANCFSADMIGKVKNRDYEVKEQGRTVNGMFLQTAFHLGMGQGYRRRQAEVEKCIPYLERLEEMAKKNPEIEIYVENIRFFIDHFSKES